MGVALRLRKHRHVIRQGLQFQDPLSGPDCLSGLAITLGMRPAPMVPHMAESNSSKPDERTQRNLTWETIGIALST